MMNNPTDQIAPEADEASEDAQAPDVHADTENDEIRATDIVFDCPPRSYKLRVSDETENKAALVEIPLTFGSETPELPAPAIPEKK